MIIVIDGYNVLKHVHGSTFVEPNIRDDFIKKLQTYGKSKSHNIVLVFDGGAYGYASSERHGVVTVMYVGMHETADDAIKRYVDQHQQREMIVVTHDRELIDYAHAVQVPTIDVWPFMECLHKKEIKKVRRNMSDMPARKLHVESINPELDALLMQTHVTPKEFCDESFMQKKVNKKESKWERKLAKIIQKL